MKDEIFTQPLQKQFEFNASVASVFDDMASRSIPFYNAVCKLVCDFLSLELNTGARVADLGCSTATTLLALWQKRQDLRLKGFDNSTQMLEIAAKKCEAYGAKIEFECSDILEADFEADSVILNYSLQFIRPPKRAKFVEKIFNSLSVGGSLVLSEKLAFTNAKFAKEMITIYEDYKILQGYTQTEIAAKRAALENVLVPFSLQENQTMLFEAGFKRVELLFCWANFATLVAFKE